VLLVALPKAAFKLDSGQRESKFSEQTWEKIVLLVLSNYSS